MPDQIGQSNYDCDGRSRQSMHSYRSVWIAHWMRAACNTAPQIQSCPFGNTDGSNAKQSHLLIKRQAEDDVSRSAKEVETRTSEIMNENSRNGGSSCRPFPNFYPRRNTGSTSVANNDQDNSHIEAQDNSHIEALRPQNMQKFEYVTALHTSNSHFSSVHKEATPATEPSARAGHLQHETRLRNHSEPRKPQILQDSRFADTRPACHLVPYQAIYGEDSLENGKHAQSSFICREEVNRLRSLLASEECLPSPSASLIGLEHGQSALFVCEKTMDGRSDYVSAIRNLRQGNIRRLIHDPSASSNHSPDFGGEEYQKMQNHTGIVVFPIENNPVKMTKSEKLDHGCYSLKRMPGSVQDVETMRICTTVDSVEGLPGWPARYSPTTHSLLITKKGDVNSCKEKQIFRESTISTQIEGTAIGKLHSLCPQFGHVPRVKLQQLSSSNESEVKENVDIFNAYVSENESSAETDTMDVDVFGDKNFLSGECCPPSDKETMLEPNPLHRVESKHPAVELPDINLVPPTLPSAASLMEHAEPSISRTQSLDMELLLSHAERLGDAESNDHQDGLLRPEPTSRWLKRLKSSASDTSAVGTKSLNLDQDSSHGKVNKFQNTVMKKNILV